MAHGHLRMIADKCQGVFAEALLNAWGTALQFCRRQRGIPPLRLGLARTAPCARQRVETRADCPCGFHALCGPPGPCVVTRESKRQSVLSRSFCSRYASDR